MTRWSDIKSALITQFHRYDSDFDMQRKILDRRQQGQETSMTFITQYCAHGFKILSPLNEKDLDNIMKGNLKPTMAHLLF